MDINVIFTINVGGLAPYTIPLFTKTKKNSKKKKKLCFYQIINFFFHTCTVFCFHRGSPRFTYPSFKVLILFSYLIQFLFPYLASLSFYYVLLTVFENLLEPNSCSVFFFKFCYQLHIHTYCTFRILKGYS